MKKSLVCAALLTLCLTGGVAAQAERPPFPSIQVSDLNGQPYQLKDFLGAVTLLNFWATWCGPCRIELPELQRLYNELGGKGLVVLAINVDVPAMAAGGIGDQIRAVRPRIDGFLGRSGVTLPIYLVDGRTQNELGIDRLPFSILLDREGRAVQAYPGYSPEAMQQLRQLALGLLSERRGQGGK